MPGGSAGETELTDLGQVVSSSHAAGRTPMAASAHPPPAEMLRRGYSRWALTPITGPPSHRAVAGQERRDTGQQGDPR